MVSMAPGVPLGDRDFGLWNGPNWTVVPTDGNVASDMFRRALIQKIGQRLIGDVTGNYKAILAAKEVCHDIMVVFVGQDKSVVYTALGQAFNLSLAHAMNVSRLFDQMAVVVCVPAHVAMKNVRPPTAATFWIERDFVKTTRQTTMEFPGQVVHAVETLRARLSSFDPVGGSNDPEEDERRVSAKERFDDVTNETIRALSACFAAPAYALKKSFEQGIVDQALMTLVDTSVPYALAKVTHRFATSIAEGSTPGDWESNAQLQKTLAREYAEKSCESTFLLAKRPERFLSELIKTGLETVQKIAHTKSLATVYDSTDEVTHPLGGVVVLSDQAYQFVVGDPAISRWQLKSGYLLDRKPVFFKPADAFSQNDPTRSVSMLYDNDDHVRDGSALEDIVKSVRDRRGDAKTGGIVRLSNLGKRLLAGRRRRPADSDDSDDDDDSDSRRSHGSRYVLSAYDVVEPYQYVLYENKAYAIERAREYFPIGDRFDFYGRSPSLVSLKHNLFRVSVGDVDDEHDQLNRWAAGVATGATADRCRTGTAEAYKMFVVKPVHIYTPGLSPQRLTFGASELRTALMDPALYDATAQEGAMNRNLRELARRDEAGLQFLKSLFERKLSAADQARALYGKYNEERTSTGDVHSRGQQALAALQSIALNPFFDVRTRPVSSTTTREFAFVKRTVFLEIPPYEMPYHVSKMRGCFLLAKGASDETIATVNRKLCEAESKITRTVYGMSGADEIPGELVDCATLLGDMVKKVFARSGFPVSRINYLFQPFSAPDPPQPPVDGDAAGKPAVTPYWLLMKYVLFPVATRGRVSFSNAAGTERATKTLVMDEVAVLKEEFESTPDELKMFDGDRLFLERHVMGAKTNWIVKKTNWPPVLQAAVLIMEYCLLTPSAMTALLCEDCHPGFAVDFIRHEAVYSEQALFTTVGSHEMILSPGGVTEKEKADGGIDLTVRGDVHTTRNTLGAGAVLVPSVCPNENGIPRAQNAAGRPIVSRDGVARTSYRTLKTALANARTVSEADKRVISDQLNSPRSTTTTAPDEFVPVLRPVDRPTEKLRPVMGLEKCSCLPVPGSVNSAWENFYASGEISRNSYASELGGLYSLRYTKDNTVVLEGRNGFLLQTTNSVASPTDVACLTTDVLETLYDLTYFAGTLTPHEASVLKINSARHFQSACGMTFRTKPPQLGDPEVCGRPLLGKLDVPAVMGLSVPYTQTTDRTRFAESDDRKPYRDSGLTQTLKGPNDYYILSPFTVPPPRQ